MANGSRTTNGKSGFPGLLWVGRGHYWIPEKERREADKWEAGFVGKTSAIPWHYLPDYQ
jgi:hypothetical protein